jgi:hypothetical protein
VSERRPVLRDSGRSARGTRDVVPPNMMPFPPIQLYARRQLASRVSQPFGPGKSAI